MKLALFLHVYQPPTQFPEILHRVVRECYEPLVSILEVNPSSKITLNVSGSLIEQLGFGHRDLLEKLRRLVSRGQVEITGSACYHPLLTELPDEEIRRQIRLNETFIKNSLGVTPGLGGGFFAPEMAIDKRVFQIVKELGYRYVFAEETAVPLGQRDLLNHSRLFIDKDTKMRVVCRHKNLSLDIAFARLRSISDFLDMVSGMPYVVLSMDGETFGHHHPEQMDLLRSLLQYYVISEKLELVTTSELLLVEPVFEISVAKSCWAESFNRWNNPGNPFHVFQWQLLNLSIKAVETYPQRDDGFWKARTLLDKALHSDQFWWSSHNPCWHYAMMERGARALLDVVVALPSATPEKNEARRLYDEITQTGLKMYGNTVIGC